MGEGVFGAEAASQAYFNKPAAKLTKMQAARIASALPHPKKYTIKPLSAYVLKRQFWVIKQMNFLKRDTEIKKIVEARPE